MLLLNPFYRHCFCHRSEEFVNFVPDSKTSRCHSKFGCSYEFCVKIGYLCTMEPVNGVLKILIFSCWLY